MGSQDLLNGNGSWFFVCLVVWDDDYRQPMREVMVKVSGVI